MDKLDGSVQWSFRSGCGLSIHQCLTNFTHVSVRQTTSCWPTTHPVIFNGYTLLSRFKPVSIADRVALSIPLTENILNLQRVGWENPTGIHSRSKTRSRSGAAKEGPARRGVTARNWMVDMPVEGRGRWASISITRDVRPTSVE